NPTGRSCTPSTRSGSAPRRVSRTIGQPTWRVTNSAQPTATPRKAQTAAARLRSPARPVELRLAARRRTTITARWEGQRIVMLAPAAVGLERLVAAGEGLITRLEKKATRATNHKRSYAQLQALAEALNEKYLGGRAEWTSIAWVENMTTRWGSCTPSTG